MDADFDRPLKTPHLFLPRPWTSTRGRRDDVDRWSHFWLLILASLRGWNHLARFDRRARRAVAVARDERRLHLHSRVIRRLDNRSAGNGRRQTPPLETHRKRDCAAARVLYHGHRGDLDSAA